MKTAHEWAREVDDDLARLYLESWLPVQIGPVTVRYFSAEVSEIVLCLTDEEKRGSGFPVVVQSASAVEHCDDMETLLGCLARHINKHCRMMNKLNTQRKRDYEVGDCVTRSDPGLMMPGVPARVTAIHEIRGGEWAQYGRGAGTMVVPTWKLKRWKPHA